MSRAHNRHNGDAGGNFLLSKVFLVERQGLGRRVLPARPRQNESGPPGPARVGCKQRAQRITDNGMTTSEFGVGWGSVEGSFPAVVLRSGCREAILLAIVFGSSLLLVSIGLVGVVLLYTRRRSFLFLGDAYKLASYHCLGMGLTRFWVLFCHR